MCNSFYVIFVVFVCLKIFSVKVKRHCKSNVSIKNKFNNVKILDLVVFPHKTFLQLFFLNSFKVISDFCKKKKKSLLGHILFSLALSDFTCTLTAYQSKWCAVTLKQVLRSKVKVIAVLFEIQFGTITSISMDKSCSEFYQKITY